MMASAEVQEQFVRPKQMHVQVRFSLCMSTSMLCTLVFMSASDQETVAED